MQLHLRSHLKLRLRAGKLGLGAAQLGVGRVDALLRGGAGIDAALAAIFRLSVGQIRLGFDHLGVGFIALGRILHLRERQLRLGLMKLRFGQTKLGFCLVALGSGVPGIDGHQQIALFHALVIPHPQFGDIACGFGRDGHGVAFGKGVVRRLLVTGHEPPYQGHNDHHDHHNAQNNQRLFAGAFTLRLFFIGVFGVFGGLVFFSHITASVLLVNGITIYAVH